MHPRATTADCVCICEIYITGTYIYIVGIVQIAFQGAGRLDLCRISLQQAQVLGILVALPSNLLLEIWPV